MKLRHLMVLLLPLITGCATHSFIKTGTNPVFPPKPTNCQLDIFTQLPDKPLIELGVCYGRASGSGVGFSPEPAPLAVEQLKKCACENGGDLIFLRGTGSEIGGVTGFGAYQQMGYTITGQVYRYK